MAVKTNLEILSNIFRVAILEVHYSIKWYLVIENV